jgi:hypothetical protein
MLLRLKLSLATWFASVGLVALAASADAAPAPPVTLGQITTRLELRRSDLERAFRNTVQEELQRSGLSRIPSRERFVLSAALVQLDTRTKSRRAQSTCVVSATLSNARGGALHAIIDGRARAEDAPGATHQAELAAMRSAVESVFRRVPQALK